MRQLTLLTLLLLCLIAPQYGFSNPVDRIDPPYWFVGMNNPELQLLIQGKSITNAAIRIVDTKVRLIRQVQPENPNYTLLYLDLSEVQDAQACEIEIKQGRKTERITYTLKNRNPHQPLGLDQGDLMYLIFPDRFANGNEENDIVVGMNETRLNRDSLFHRHGGDIQGIISHLDYLGDMGFNALWINPLIENNQAFESYHGYAATDLYQIDPRFGSNEEYLRLAEVCREKEIKMVMDVVLNHWGDQHYLIKDLVDSDWVNPQEPFKRTNYRATTLFDPYASRADRSTMTDGWFDHHMPDLNQRNKDLAHYLIQNHIWWIETAGIDALRIDTYAYPDQQFMSDYTHALKKEFPELTLFGETWVHGTPTQAWFVGETELGRQFENAMDAVTDFQLYYAVNRALTEGFGWTEGVSSIYYTLAKDLLYPHPEKLVTFLDNHDLSRFYSMVGEDMRKFKMGLAFLYTTRGIPCVYYGTEIAMKNFADPDGKVRSDFPGGWPNDAHNKFLASGRAAHEQEAHQFLRQLGQWRQGNQLISSGKLMQFVPEKGVYTYFRYTDDSALMMIMNTGPDTQTIQLDRFRERLSPFSFGYNVLTGEKTDISLPVTLASYEFLLIEMNQ